MIVLNHGSFKHSLFGHDGCVDSVVDEGFVRVGKVNGGSLNALGEFGTFEVARGFAADVKGAEEGIVGRGFEGVNDFGESGRHHSDY